MGEFAWRNNATYSVCNSRERQIAALGFLKDWVTAIVGLDDRRTRCTWYLC